MGAFEHPDDENFDWQDGTLSVIPTEIDVNISNQGHYIIEADIEAGKSFEKAIEVIDFTHGDFSVKILPQKEFDLYQDNPEKSILKEYTQHTRIYNPKDLELWR